tara:strand:- start:711 stop:1259 length:549 start_codon:yes stop_codon:yes gene_type:complete
MAFGAEDLFEYWERLGVFDIVLPFLLVFAIVYGILKYMKIFGNDKGVHAILSIVIGILAVRYTEFTYFYRELFPRLGIGLTILLVFLILVGMFASDKSMTIFMWIFSIIGLIIAIAVVYNSAAVFGWVDGFGGGASEWISWIVSAVLLIGVIVVIVMGNIDTTGSTAAKAAPMFSLTSGGKP